MINDSVNTSGSAKVSPALTHRAAKTVGTTIQKTSVAVPLMLSGKGIQVSAKTGISKLSEGGSSHKLSGKAGPVKMSAKLDVGTTTMANDLRTKASAKGVKADLRTTYKYTPLQVSLNAKSSKTSASVSAGASSKVSMSQKNEPEYNMGVKVKAQLTQSIGGRKVGLTGIAKATISPEEPKLAPDLGMAVKLSVSKMKEKQD